MATKRSDFEAAKWARAAEMARQAADAMTDEESDAVTAAALRDPDCPPQTREQVARMRPEPLVRGVRLRLGLSQQAFADRYGIPVANIRASRDRRSEAGGGDGEPAGDDRRGPGRPGAGACRGGAAGT